MNIETIEQELKTGQVVPERLAQMSDWLAGTSSSLMDRQLELQMTFAQYHRDVRDEFKSDKAVQLAWQTSELGKEELQLETAQKKIKVLLQTIGRHLKVAHDQAYNRY